jgi:hypothetical protein
VSVIASKETDKAPDRKSPARLFNGDRRPGRRLRAGRQFALILLHMDGAARRFPRDARA